MAADFPYQQFVTYTHHTHTATATHPLLSNDYRPFKAFPALHTSRLLPSLFLISLILSCSVSSLPLDCSRLSISFPSLRSAHVVYSAVSVDPELRPDRVQRSMTVKDNTLSLAFASSDFQHLRVSVASTMDAIMLATRTLAAFNDTQKP
jgi:tRNA threonylcarbamoyladenosine modification (KEOPS) complex  Pcc1 subunit